MLRKCKAERWTESRKKAESKATAKAVQKIADEAASNAAIAERIKRKALLMIDRLFDEFEDMHGTEHRDYDGNNITDIKRLRDLTTALKDVTGDMPTGGGQTNELIQSLLDLERRRGNGD